MTEDTQPFDIKFQKRFTGNFISNIVYFVLNFLVGILLVPFFIDTLGYGAYGLIPLATSITSYVTMVIDALNYAISRYLTIDLQKNDKYNANITFNTALFGSLSVIILLIPVVIVVSWLAPSFFDIGTASTTSVFLLFLLVFLSAFIRTWSSNFMQTLFAYNRLDLRNIVNISNIVLQVSLIIILFYVFKPSLIFVGFAYIAAAIFALFLSVYFSRRVAKNLNIDIKLFSKSRLFDIVGIAIWSLIGNVGCALTSSFALIIVNKLLGEITGADYSIALTINTGLIAVASLLTTTFTPMVYSYYSKNDIQGLLTFCKLGIKTSGMVMALPISLVCLFSAQILSIWVGPERAYLSPLIWIVVISALMNVMVAPISTIGLCYLKVRFQCISALLSGVLSSVLACVFIICFNWGIYGAAFGIVIGSWLHSCIMCPMYFSKLINGLYLNFIPTMYKTCTYMLIIIIPGWVILQLLNTSSLIICGIVGMAITIIYIIIMPKIILKKEEREYIRTCFPRVLRNIIPCWLF